MWSLACFYGGLIIERNICVSKIGSVRLVILPFLLLPLGSITPINSTTQLFTKGLTMLVVYDKRFQFVKNDPFNEAGGGGGDSWKKCNVKT